ncbi:hypothetical protein AURANDRAFT_20216 [Aureococcus anophagefferens]|uniref:cGMP-dependent protein kinase n=1 Tax=Aureococcus anophagefferens TaxID=44056 RepID=F0XYA5_AURAN|nr:hypothetical protein AURANDRAFT_20216 [Aureococcus anophagefferens]EGB12206.1 hypothetical protein AURANDRAFT_20216 [Aureococcus anophagefferens]|eukprot:XP_009033278.1 hypothetical protein AURANDRAFT_20216 [Aureococcus anophagefferens]
MSSFFKQKKRAVITNNPATFEATEEDDKAFTATPKTEKEKALLINALKDHYVFSALSTTDILQVIHRMKKHERPSGDVVIQEGDEGDTFYVLFSGTAEILVGAKKVGEYAAGHSFGELALLYSAKRAATIRATSPCVLWSVDIKTFHRLVIRTQQGAAQGRLAFLKKVPLMQGLDTATLQKVADALQSVSFPEGHKIITEGEQGDDFFIIESGEVKCTHTKPSGGEQHLLTLKRGDYFGEMALMLDEPRHANPRAANIVATEQLECLVLDRVSFQTWLADVDAVKKKQKEKKAAVATARPAARDLQRLRTLGTGTFGRVSLVVHAPTNSVYALKAMQKEQVVQSHQERNIMNEKNLLMQCAHPMVLGLVATYQDRDQIYMLMEIVQGGELWSLVYEKVAETKALRVGGFGGFGQPAAQFFGGCVIEAFAHIHGHGIAYRDLKPENLLLDAKGYVKVIDFGFAKQVPWEDKKGFHDKSYTICGTPEYLAPEIIQSKGHDQAVDYWALGCLVYELLVGRTPFADDRQPEIFRKILAAPKALDGDRLWPRGFPAEAKALVQALLKSAPAYRLGMGKSSVQDIKNQAWFASTKFDWAKLAALGIKSPYVPPIKDPLDTSNFDPYDEDTGVARYSGTQQVFAPWSEMGADFPPQKA